mgnify:CR=1 FL=1
MPFKSQAQRRKFAEMLVRGEISAETFEEWNRETGDAVLPERVNRPRKKAAKKTAAGKKIFQEEVSAESDGLGVALHS